MKPYLNSRVNPINGTSTKRRPIIAWILLNFMLDIIPHPAEYDHPLLIKERVGVRSGYNHHEFASQFIWIF